MKKVIVCVLLVCCITGMLFAAGGGEKDNTLIIYSNSVSDGRGEWLKAEAAKEGFSIEYLDAGGGEVLNRLIAEKSNSIADVVFGTPQYETLKEEGLLAKYTPVWAAEIPTGFNDPEGYYHAIISQALVMVYDSSRWTAETAPQDWLDLWQNSEFHGKYITQTSLGGGTVRNIIASILMRYTDTNGELGISDEGWNEIEAFFEYGVPAEAGIDLFSTIADGRAEFGQMWSSGIKAREEQYGFKAGIVDPEIGVPFVLEHVAIIEGTEKLDEAKRFVDWFGSAKVQEAWAIEFGSIPAHPGATSALSAENKWIVDNLKPQIIDAAFFAANIDAWCEKIELEYMF